MTKSTDAKAFRWAIANTLELIGGKGDVNDLIRLLRDSRSGSARGVLGLAAAKTKDKRIVPILPPLRGFMYVEEACFGFCVSHIGGVC